MNREKLDGWCERGVLGLVLAILVFGPLATGAVRTPDFLVIQGLTLGVLVLWGLRLWLSPGPRLLWPPICWAVTAFVIYAIARYLTADIEYVARQELIRVLVYAFLFFAILNNLRRQQTLPVITCTLVFLGMAISFYAIYQFATKSDRVWTFITPYKGRGGGTYICPNHLAGFLEMLLPIGLAYTLASRLKPLLKVFLGYASLVICAGITVTLSRGGWVASIAALIVFFGLLLLHRNSRLPALVLLGALIWGGLFLVPKAYQLRFRVERTFKAGQVEDPRLELWRPAAQIWKENVWWGAGPAHFDYRFRAFRPESIQRQPDRVHNDYLNALTDWGIAGAALVLLAWGLLFLGVARTWRHVRGGDDLANRTSNKLAAVLGGSVGLLAILLHSSVDFNFHIPANAIVAISLMALLTSQLRFVTERYWVALRIPGKVIASTLVAAGIAYLGWQGWRHSVEYAWLERAKASPPYSPEQIAALEEAWTAEPMNYSTAYAIAEAFRMQSWEGGPSFATLAQKAMDWYKPSMRLNPYDGYNYMRYGMCLDWLDRHDEAGPYFDRALELDPNGYYTVAHIGWHYVQLGEYAAARPWFQRSRRLQTSNNPIAESYLERVVNVRLAEAAAP